MPPKISVIPIRKDHSKRSLSISDEESAESQPKRVNFEEPATDFSASSSQDQHNPSDHESASSSDNLFTQSDDELYSGMRVVNSLDLPQMSTGSSISRPRRGLNPIDRYADLDFAQPISSSDLDSVRSALGDDDLDLEAQASRLSELTQTRARKQSSKKSPSVPKSSSASSTSEGSSSSLCVLVLFHI